MGIEAIFAQTSNKESVFNVLNNGLKHAYEDTTSSPLASDNLWSADFEIYTMLMEEDLLDDEALYKRILEEYNISEDKKSWLEEWINNNREKINFILVERAKIREKLKKLES